MRYLLLIVAPTMPTPPLPNGARTCRRAIAGGTSHAQTVAAGSSLRTAGVRRVAATLKPTVDSDIASRFGCRPRTGTVSSRRSATAPSTAHRDPALINACGAATRPPRPIPHIGGGASFALGHPEKVIDSAGAPCTRRPSPRRDRRGVLRNRTEILVLNGCSAGGSGDSAAQRFPATSTGYRRPGLD